METAQGGIGEIGACNEAARREVIAPSLAKRVASHGCYTFWFGEVVADPIWGPIKYI